MELTSRGNKGMLVRLLDFMSKGRRSLMAFKLGRQPPRIMKCAEHSYVAYYGRKPILLEVTRREECEDGLINLPDLSVSGIVGAADAANNDDNGTTASRTS
jgi:hypothetical protein